MLNGHRFSMLKSSSFEVDTSILFQVQERETELDQLIMQLDIAQSEFDRLSVEISEKQNEFEVKQHQIVCEQKVRQAKDFVGPSVRTVISDEFEMDQEHLDFLRDKRNEITILNSAIERFENETDSATEVAFLRQNISLLRSELADVQTQLERSVSKRRKFDEEIDGCRAQRKEMNNEIRAYRKITKDVETAKIGLIARQESYAAACDPKSGFPSVLANLQKEIDSVNNEIALIDDQIHEFESAKLIPTSKQKDRSSEWMLTMDEDLEAVQETINIKARELENRLKVIAILEGRYNKLQPIVFKWKKQRVDITETATHIDELLRQLTKCEKPLRHTEVNAISVKNAELLTQIMRLRKEITSAIQIFSIEETRLKKQIEKHKIDCAEREKKIVDEMYELKLKAAERNLKNGRFLDSSVDTS
jgi:hypothetical protein